MITFPANPLPKRKSAPKLVHTTFGIDPGKSGAIVEIGPKHTLIGVHKMPASDADLSNLLDIVVHATDHSTVWIERVPKFAGKNQSGASVATLFANYRFIVGYLVGRGVDVHEVVPQVWMKPYRLLASDWQMMNYNDRKKYLHAMALSEFFVDSKTLPRWSADAALIALHGASQGDKLN
jgi:hypothetical protein